VLVEGEVSLVHAVAVAVVAELLQDGQDLLVEGVPAAGLAIA
jgi:hypothetical protein